MEVPQGNGRFERPVRFSRQAPYCSPSRGTSIGPRGSGGTAPSSVSLLLTMNDIASSSLLESGAVALRNLATLFLRQNTRQVQGPVPQDPIPAVGGRIAPASLVAILLAGLNVERLA